MAELSLVSGAVKSRVPVGNRMLVVAKADEVTSGGTDHLTGGTLGLSEIDGIVGVACAESAVAVQAVENSQDGGSTTTNGSVTLITASGTHDVWVAVLGIPGTP